jgi:hypothetical protein
MAPVQVVYLEACLDLSLAKARERQLRTGFGRAYLKRRLGFSWASVVFRPSVTSFGRSKNPGSGFVRE